VCAVSGSVSAVYALQDHAQMMQMEEAVEGADQRLLDLMRPAVIQILTDEPVETFTDEVDASLDEES